MLARALILIVFAAAFAGCADNPVQAADPVGSIAQDLPAGTAIHRKTLVLASHTTAGAGLPDGKTAAGVHPTPEDFQVDEPGTVFARVTLHWNASTPAAASFRLWLGDGKTSYGEAVGRSPLGFDVSAGLPAGGYTVGAFPAAGGVTVDDELTFVIDLDYQAPSSADHTTSG